PAPTCRPAPAVPGRSSPAGARGRPCGRRRAGRGARPSPRPRPGARSPAPGPGGPPRPGSMARTPHRPPRAAKPGPWALKLRSLVQMGRTRGSVPAMKAGDTVPDFELPDETGTKRKLGDFLANGPVVLFF